MCEMKKYYFSVKEQRNILHEKVNGRLTGLVTFCVETVFYNRLRKWG